MERYTVIINERAGALVAGGRQAVLERIRQGLNEAGADADFHLRTGEEIGEEIQRAVASDAERVIVGGGDGTINAAAAAVVDAGKTLGILPMGTMNLFAQDLGIPLNLYQAARALVRGETRQVDYAEVNGRLYLCNSIIGLLPPIAHQRERLRGRSFFRRWWGLLRTAYRLLKRDPRLGVHLSMDGQELQLKVRGVAVCNNAYHDAYALLPHPVPLDAGRLAVYVAREPTRWGTLRLTMRLFLGTWKKERDMLQYATETVTISTPRRRLATVTDGELIRLEPPLSYRIHPRALRVIMPRVEDRQQPALAQTEIDGSNP